MPISTGIELYRIAMKIRIDDHADGQTSQAKAKMQQLSDAFRGFITEGTVATISLEFPDPVSVPAGTEVCCMAQGIISTTEVRGG